ncbi:MAG: hypothetical protein ABJO30_05455 [Hyphomicrobiales bacterium]
MPKKRSWLDTGFVPHRLEMKLSPAWNVKPVPLWRILDRLETEHMRHGGMNNGELFVSYNQFMEAGVSKRRISSMLECGEQLGFIEIVRPIDSWRGDVRAPNRYRLTYLPTRNVKPTDEWKKIQSIEQAQTIVEQFSEKKIQSEKRKDKACLAKAS